jgi:hypothetical protein
MADRLDAASIPSGVVYVCATGSGKAQLEFGVVRHGAVVRQARGRLDTGVDTDVAMRVASRRKFVLAT